MFDIIDFAEQLNDLISENRRLREENEYLRDKVKEHNIWIDRQYKETQNQIGSILSTLLSKAE